MPKDKKSSLEIIFQHLNLQQQPKQQTPPAKIMERPKTPLSPALSIETTISDPPSPKPLPEPKPIIISSTEPSKTNNNDCIEPNTKHPRIYPPSNITTPPATNTNEKTTVPSNVYTKKHLLNNLPIAKAVLIKRGNEVFATKNPIFFNSHDGSGSSTQLLAGGIRPRPLMSLHVPRPPNIRFSQPYPNMPQQNSRLTPMPYQFNPLPPTQYYWNKRN